MNPATRKQDDNAVEPMLHMALELSNTWRLTFGEGGKRRQGSIALGLCCRKYFRCAAPPF